MNFDILLVQTFERNPTHYGSNLINLNPEEEIEKICDEQTKIWNELFFQTIKAAELKEADRKYAESMLRASLEHYRNFTAFKKTAFGFEIEAPLPILQPNVSFFLDQLPPLDVFGALITSLAIAQNIMKIDWNPPPCSPLIFVVTAHYESLRNSCRDRTVHTQIINELEKKLEGLETRQKALEEAKAFTSVWKIWNARTCNLGAQFWIGLFAVSACVVFGTFFFVENGKDFIAKIPKKEELDIAYGVLALLFVPIIGIAWVLRIIGRLVTNSLTLKEDADHRRAMLETYFNLLSDPNANFKDKERILVLNAIFRPLPGHQSEDVSPPTLADLAKDHFGAKEEK